MSFNRKQPLNITINGNDLNGPELNQKNDNQYENYIIKTNKELHKTNKELENKIIEVENEKLNLEDELGKEEAKRIYMKGLMHNLNEIKKKLDKHSRKNELMNENYKIYFTYYKDIFYKLDKYLNTENIRIIVGFYLLIPVILIFFNYIFNSSLFTILSMVYHFVIFFVFCYISDLIYNENNIKQFQEYEIFEINNKRMNLENKKLMNDIKEIENAIKDIDLIIDEC